MNERRYDVIIAGSGAAGLSLVHHLLHSPLRDCSLLVIDREATTCQDRTWCFWADRPTPFDDLIHRSWTRLQIVSAAAAAAVDLHPYRYNMIRGLDVHRHVQRELAQCDNVVVRQGTVDRIVDGTDGAEVIVDGLVYAGHWVFDSRVAPSVSTPSSHQYVHLLQHFKGWELETSSPVFNPQVATLLDFRAPSRGSVSFFHVLPLSPQRALIDRVEMTDALVPPRGHDPELAPYLRNVLRIEDYHICREEHGVSHLTDRPFPRRAGRHVMPIGIPGGRIKPSTGYAFLRIQRDCAAIVRSLLQAGHPFDVPASPRRYRFFDAVVLRIMQRHPEWIEPIFTSLFTRQPAERLLRCLDEEASVPDNVMMLPALTPRLLVEAGRDIGALRWA